MGVLGFTLRVTSDDGSEQRVKADMRDSIRFEREHQVSALKALANMPTAFFYSVAFYALQRQGVIGKDVKRDEWENTIPEVKLLDETESAPADPGNPEASDEMPSSSRSGVGRASGKSATTGRRGTALR